MTDGYIFLPGGTITENNRTAKPEKPSGFSRGDSEKSNSTAVRRFYRFFEKINKLYV